jgi:hypothetical protein
MTRRRSRPATLPMLDTGRVGRTGAPRCDKISTVPGQNGNNCADAATIVIARHSSQRNGTRRETQNTVAHTRLGASDQPPQHQSP